MIAFEILCVGLLFPRAAFATSLIPRWNSSYSYSPLPFTDGFPSPSNSSLHAIEATAHGLFPQGSPGANITSAGVTNLQLFQLLSSISAVYYDEVVHAMTSDSHFNTTIPSWIDSEDFVAFASEAKAIDELYYLSSSRALGYFNSTSISPCTNYHLPVDSFSDAMDFGIIFQSNFVGTLGQLSGFFADNGVADSYLIELFAGISATKGAQVAQMRRYLGFSSIQSPWWTRGERDLTFSYLQTLVDVSSCPYISSIDLHTSVPLTVANYSVAQSITLEMPSSSYKVGSNYSVVLLNGASSAAVQTNTVVTPGNSTVSVEAPFPFVGLYTNTTSIPDGLTVFAVVAGSHPFSVASNAALAGPAFVRIN